MSTEAIKNPIFQVQVGPPPDHQTLKIAQELLEQAEEVDIISKLTAGEREQLQKAIQRGIKPADALAQIAVQRHNQRLREALEQVAPEAPSLPIQTEEVSNSITEITIEVLF